MIHRNSPLSVENFNIERKIIKHIAIHNGYNINDRLIFSRKLYKVISKLYSIELNWR